MSDDRFQARNLYDVYNCTIKFTDRLCGGVPQNKDLIETWVKARTGYDDELTQAQTKEAVNDLVDDVMEKSWVGFFSDERGLWLHSRNVKAAFKQGASMLRLTKTKAGSKQIFNEGMEIKSATGDHKLYFARKKPDGTEEKPIHVMTAQGPRTALKRFDYVNGVILKFEIWVLKTAPQESRHIGEEDLVKVLTFMQENGIGADRSQGEGKFEVIEFAKAK